MTFWIALLGALTGSAGLILHALARRYPKLGTIAKDVDQVATMIPKE